MNRPGRVRRHEPVHPGRRAIRLGRAEVPGQPDGPGGPGGPDRDTEPVEPGVSEPAVSASAGAESGRTGAGHRTVRRHNLALVLHEVAAGEPVSRAAVAARTGLTRGTVSSLVEELLTDGLIIELAATRGGTGRPANPLQLNRFGPAGLGLEIGVDHVSACVVDLTGAVRATRSAGSTHRDLPPAAGLARAVELATEVIAEAGLTITGAGVALPGMIGPDGELQHAPNLPRWIDVPVPPELSRRLGGIRVHTGNEADLAALAELWFADPDPGSGSSGRAARAASATGTDGADPAAGGSGELGADFLFVSGGIGVGAGIVLGGELFRGAGGRAGELGHVVVDPDGPRCSCGGRGCLEQAAGQEALLRVTGSATVDELLARPDAAIGPAARALGVALTGAVHLLDVRTVVLGGLFARLGDELRRAVDVELTARVGRVDVRLSRPGTGGALRAAAASVVRARLSLL